ncbi:MAG: hypothetical protein AW09_000035 [Candidatus Accumulibacter phosphatis]|uniref:Uncharacterized protein n=1 Tax=Candidatus Accumulibacter phosphatis TaxID=327160 RepID=A0A080M067_9PROT|nr:MAG: hypothetical protein AW09_000035 [Candidatus Accumulibacter phosphatis]
MVLSQSVVGIRAKRTKGCEGSSGLGENLGVLCLGRLACKIKRADRFTTLCGDPIQVHFRLTP